ncbi:lysylphosphatidylglycerol synthase transmembrane domain-containing protein [Candidatus Palauibacter sp.]|uniref:lysylphosphatidylglycerol synthase transmembrane domain-containing protein n=1 Tax=Candidatus Palauibacter sp. TaxID=3101350 RepID=UPI003D0B6C35
MASPQPSSPIPARGKLVVGALAFAGLTALGLVALIRWRPPSELDSILARITPGFAIALLALLALDFTLGGLRYRLLLDGRVFSRVSLWHCMRANWANMLLGAITPAQTGGGAAQLYVLCRRGARLSEAILCSLLTFVATLLFFALGGLAALAFLPGEALSRGVLVALVIAVVAIAGLAGLLGLAVVAQRPTVRVIRRFLNAASRRGTRVRRWAAAGRRLLSSEIERLAAGIRAVVARGKVTLVWVCAGTALLYFNKYLMGYVLAAALQGPVDGSFIGLQLFQHIVLYFAPTPGASGVAEASTGLLMNRVLLAEVTVLWVVGWRLLTTFFGTILGVFVLLGEARRHVGEVRADETDGTA